MKRRAFLTSAIALSLFGTEPLAAPAAKPKKAPAKPAAKPSRKKPGPAAKKPAAPARAVAHTADDPIIDTPPVGTSASRLPPSKAVELPAEWRTYEVTCTVELPPGPGPRTLWLPLPLNQDTVYQRTLGHAWTGTQRSASIRRLPDGDLEAFVADWADHDDARLTLTTQITTADRQFDITRRTVPPEREDILRRNLQATRQLPNDGLAHQLGERIIGRIKDPVAQAKAIFDWVIEQSIYDPALPVCGAGNVRQQLLHGQYGGRSADINGLFVALCRAVGIPARCVFGLRVAPSRLIGSLGLSSSDATTGQHVRAEFYIPGYGWIPADPSDVRRAMALNLLSDADSRLASLRRVLFGVWEMNWVAFNVGLDITLPGQQGNIPFLITPRLDSPAGPLDGSDPGRFRYSLTARQVVL